MTVVVVMVGPVPVVSVGEGKPLNPGVLYRVYVLAPPNQCQEESRRRRRRNVPVGQVVWRGLVRRDPPPERPAREGRQGRRWKEGRRRREGGVG